jgi:hypothetical protein
VFYLILEFENGSIEFCDLQSFLVEAFIQFGLSLLVLAFYF